jgi:hypothetical protein
MPVTGGLLPQAGPQFNELAAITRRCFLPQLVIQIYNTSPLMASLLSNAQSAGGGVSSVTVPVQGSPMVVASAAGFDGTFNPPPSLQGVLDAEFNLQLVLTPIPFLGAEGLVQLDHAVIPLIQARMNDATNATMHFMATDAYSNVSLTNNRVIGLDGAIDDGTNMATYGNIARAAPNTWWQSYVRAAGGVAPTRKLVLQWIVGLNNYCGESPSFGVTDAATWAALAQDYVGAESFMITPGNAFDTDGDRPRSAFKALDCAGVPIFLDPYVPASDAGTIYFVNSNYLSAYWHDQAAFNFSGFESTIPNYQLGYLGVVVNAWQIVNTKCKTSARITGFTGVTGL